MTLNTFLIFIILLLPVMLIAFYRGSRFSKSPIPYFVVLVLAMLASYWTFTRYAKSHDGYYKNTDYHLIQQDGLKYPKGQTLWLASDSMPERALLATDLGELKLDGEAQLQSEGFKLPLYVEDKERPMHFRVVNLVDELYMESGDQIALKMDTSNLLTIKYEEVLSHNKIAKYRFVFSLGKRRADTVEMSKFRQGYNLVDLLQEGKHTRLDVGQQRMFEFCYLLRSDYELDVVRPEKTKGKVYLFGAGQLPEKVTAYHNNSQVSSIDGNAQNVLVGDCQFFYGLGPSRSQVYGVTVGEHDIVVNYRLPKMYHFPEVDNNNVKEGESNLFLTTDKQEIIDRRDDFDCFYQFNDGLAYNSIYKASIVMNFMIDCAGVSINPEYGDVYGNYNQSVRTPITVGEPFEVKTLSCMSNEGPAQVSYLFRIRDMRRNVVYNKAPMLYCVLLLLFLAIYLMLHYMQEPTRGRINKFYILETSVYLTLIAFLTVRLVLLWRLHTFPPIDNVSRLELTTLTNPQNFVWTVIAIIAVLLLRMFVLVFQWVARNRSFSLNEKVSDFFDWSDNKKIVFVKNRMEMSIKWIVAAVLPIVAYLICVIVSKFSVSLEVIVKEAIAPLVAFAINSLYYVYLTRNATNIRGNNQFKKRGVFCWAAIIWNTLVFLAFLLIGFHENGMLFPMSGVFAAWIFIIIFVTPVARKWFKWVLPVLAGFALIFVFWHVPMAQTPAGKALVSKMPESLSRIKARIVATSETPSEMVQNENVQFKDKSMQDILNASSNKWFIDNHLAQRYYLAKSRSGFILDKEFNQRAVNYITQTRDVVLLRYLIYEHGAGVVKKLLLILLLLSFNVFAMYKRNGSRLPFIQQLPLQSALFLLMFSSYLYLVNMNAVVFVGLDFPFLTLTSKVAPFGLLLPLLAILLPMNIKRQDDSLISDTINAGPDKVKATVGIISALLVIVLVALPDYRMQNQIKKNNGLASASFSVSMEPLAEFINDYMNPMFREYQETVNAQDKAQSNNRRARGRFERMGVYDTGLKDELQDFVFGGKEGGAPRIDGLLHEYVTTNKNRKKDEAFIRSAFEKFFNTPLTNTSNLISIRKLNGRFLFVTNKVYYDMKPMFKNNSLLQWHGDLMGAAGASRLTFVGENRKEVIGLKKGYYVYGDANDTDNNQRKLKDQFLGCKENEDRMINFNIVQIPKEYCYEPVIGDHDVYVLNPVDDPNGRDYVVYPLGDATNPIKENNVAMWVKPNDIVKVSGAKQSFSFKTESGHYFSKRIHYNGKYQVIYPLGDRFIFAYNLDQMLADTYHPTDKADEDKPITVSLDYELLNDMYDYCESAMRSKSYGDGVTVTAIDGNGRIRLLADYSPRKRNHADPNNAKELQRMMEDIYLSGNRKEERALLQNRNVARMAVGPGSTIKVPFYVALASKTHMDWTKVGVSFPTNLATFTDGQAVLSKFGNYPTKGIHAGFEGWDEMYGEYKSGQTMSASRFITTSNNFFFGSIIALATYSPTQLNNGLGGVLAPAQAKEAVFPKFSMNGQYYKFKDKFISELGDDRALESGLEDNYGFLRWRNRDFGNQTFDVSPADRIYEDDTTQSHASRMRSMNAEYVYVEKPNVHRDIRNTSSDDVVKAFLHLTSGGAKHLDVTPLGMAEMYLRIATLNSADNILTYFDDVDSIPYKPFVTVHENFASQLQTTAFEGMWNVIGGDGGTMSNATDKGLKQELSERKVNGQSKPIYIYGKTGTVGDAERSRRLGKKVQNYHYAFILSNKRLDQTTDRTGLKVYVVYFGYYENHLGHSTTATTRKEIIKKIVNSETFKNYWDN